MGMFKQVFKEFRDFAIKGNAVDMAVGIIIGGAFGKVITSLVNDVIMPPINLLLGRASQFSNFAERALTIDGQPVVKYGLFFNNVLDFLIVAFCIFVVVKQMNRLRPATEPTTKICPQCQSTIPIKAVRCAYCTSPLE